MNSIATDLLFALEDVTNKLNSILKEIGREDEVKTIFSYVIPHIKGDVKSDIHSILDLQQELNVEFTNLLVDISSRKSK